ncbi:MAG: permease-like cell division protein FtsX [Patescibacteria group bacterium]
MRAFFRMITFALQGIFRNFWLSFVTTSVLFLTLVTINAVLVLNVLANASIRAIEDRVQIELYFVPGTSEDVVKSVRGYLIGLPQVKDVTTVSADEALASFTERHANDAEILAALNEVSGNPFGDALRVQAEHPEDFPFILEAVNSPEFSEYIKDKDYADYQTVIEQLSAFTERVYWGGIGLAAFFGLISILIVFNTIRVAIYTHRDEIAVMKLVGAKDWFIRAPFLLEAIMYAFAATVIMTIVLMFALFSLEPLITRFFAGVSVNLSQFYVENGIALFFAQWIGLSLLGVATTMMAVRKFLKT